MAKIYREVIVRGNDKLLKGFLWGYKGAKSIKSGLIFAHDHPINTHHLREILTFRGAHAHIIANEVHHRGIVNAIKEATTLNFSIVSDRKIRRTYFDFEFETFNRTVAGRIKKRSRNIPAGLELLKFKEKEEVDPRDKGVEMYAVSHAYRYYGSGRIEGEVDALLKFRAKMSENDFVELDEITIVH